MGARRGSGTRDLRPSVRPPPGCGPRLTALPPGRAALGRGTVSLGLRDGAATLRLREGHEALLLPRLPAAEARPQLQALLFAMAARVRDLEERLEVLGTLSYSPEKNTPRSQQPILPDPSPRKNRAAGSALPVKRKIPGESLINPGFKSKSVPSGVDFEDS